MNQEEKERGKKELEQAQAVDHITDPKIRELYDRFPKEDAYNILDNLAPELLLNVSDRLAVLQLMVFACKVIIQDIGEHGEEHILNLYEDHDQVYFEDCRVKLEVQIAELRTKGEQSDIFDRWKAIRYPRI
ncbi:hypothetical protein FH581_014710 [Leptospira weilii]|uniref:hypothetical protein n=1 Tax=Leptospira weilii TaxID=28184 RepID=UPI000B08BBE6|nr:hypothetical protein [Leptospira weilii]ULH27797.1 hypothetical protein FH586_15570 [Leptospira weilii]UPY77178.1 hypothetical protein FH581_014710 [Leptospira weilii]